MSQNGQTHFKNLAANIMSKYFIDITTHRKLKLNNINPKANLESITDNFQNHEGVQKIKLVYFRTKSSLKLDSVSDLDVKKEILKVPSIVNTSIHVTF